MVWTAADKKYLNDRLGERFKFLINFQHKEHEKILKAVQGILAGSGGLSEAQIEAALTKVLKRNKWVIE